MAGARQRAVVMYGMTTGISARGFMVGQAPFLRQRGWDVALVCSPQGAVASFCAEEGIDFYPVPLERTPSAFRDLKAWRVLWRTLRQVRPDVTLWGSPKASLLGTLACRLQRIPAIYVIHGLRLEGATGIGRMVLRALERATCRMATVVVADGFQLREAAERLKIVRPGTVIVTAHGSANGVGPHIAKPKYRRELALEDDALVVAFAGRITTDKGIADLAEAWRAVVRDHPRAVLVVAGAPDASDPNAGALQDLLKDLPRARLLGHIDDLDRLWADADVAVLPSYREGLPLVIIEAAAAGVPAVVTDCTGGPESVVDGVTGLVVPQRNPTALATALSRLLEEPHTRHQMGHAARERALARYDRDVLWSAYEALLVDVSVNAGPPEGRHLVPNADEEHNP